MENRTTAIILTVVAVFLCGCPGVCACLYGGLSAAGLGTYTSEFGDFASSGQTPVWVGIVALCAGLLLMVVPVVVGVLTLRQKPAESYAGDLPNMDDPLPPAN